ncbi:carbon-nitrogen hydrolase family protein [Alkalimarinus sediminis]|uniref:Carbon-nitrogen hydrolase family protein n=1 Tax=Alkalimarinus sediminis TaxID=1632866 RepID=A0A9E8KMJ4_9ALTE|nr:carbon-nitrogen hydrolase family protein [Alkalimarinus sediminis]UZW73493.1 carbon-nitrogen hydrolase family protein [Alkalimarinus sediminis]
MVDSRCSAKPRIAAIQMNSSDSKAHNLDTVSRLVEEAVNLHRATLVLLPENFSLFDGTAALELGQQQATELGDVRRAISSLAAKLRVWIVAGSIPCSVRPDGSTIEERVRSACWVYNSEGKEVSRYDKIHLFDVDVGDSYGAYRESSQFEPGTSAEVVDTPVGVLGLSICYDLRFPELYALLTKKGAQLITVPAAFTHKTGQAHWEVLLRARAIENQCYVIASNQTGLHSKGRETWGHSMIIDPWGKIIAVAEEGEGVISADIDLEEITKLRAAMPVASHRRI